MNFSNIVYTDNKSKQDSLYNSLYHTIEGMDMHPLEVITVLTKLIEEENGRLEVFYEIKEKPKDEVAAVLSNLISDIINKLSETNEEE